MPTNDKKHISVGDTFTVAFECLEPVAESENDFTFAQTPISPTSATAELWSVNDQALVELGGAGMTEDSADVTGNLVTYTVDSAFTTEAGDYKLYVSATFTDGQIVTELRQFRVKEKQ